jgi:hypothetical protein
MPKILPNLNTAGQLYWAYGSNLHKEQMLRRCPGARVVGPRWLPGARLVFRSVADVVYDPNDRCPGALWRITPSDERALDDYEGVERGFYAKSYLLVRVKGRVEEMLVYVMNSTAVAPPGEHYLNVIAQGYRDFNLPLAYLDRAVELSWSDKHITADVRRRRARPSHGAVAYGVDIDALA